MTAQTFSARKYALDCSQATTRCTVQVAAAGITLALNLCHQQACKNLSAVYRVCTGNLPLFYCLSTIGVYGAIEPSLESRAGTVRGCATAVS